MTEILPEDSETASSAPSTTTPGAWSPPMASTTIVISLSLELKGVCNRVV